MRRGRCVQLVFPPFSSRWRPTRGDDVSRSSQSSWYAAKHCMTQRERGLFSSFFFALLELEHLLLFASVLWCAYVLFLGRMLFSAVIRMPASSTASFRAFYYFEGKNLRAEKLLSVRGGEQVRSVTLLMPVPYPTRVIFICTYKPDSLDRPWMFFVFRYFYSILQSFVGVELHVYVKCMMKYLFVNIQDMLYITHHIL